MNIILSCLPKGRQDFCLIYKNEVGYPCLVFRKIIDFTTNSEQGIIVIKESSYLLTRIYDGVQTVKPKPYTMSAYP